MLDAFRKIFELLDPYERRRGYVLLGFILVLGFVETLGVASVMPFMAVVGNPDLIQTNVYLNAVYERLGFQSYHRFLVFLGAVVFVVLVGSMMFSALTYWVLYRFTQMCNYRLSTRLLETYFFRPYAWFLNHHSADLGKTVLNEVNQVVALAILPAMMILSRAVVALFLLLLIVLVDPLIALSAAVILGGIYALIFLIARRYLGWLGTDMYHANEQRFKIAQEGLGGIKDVKVSGLEAEFVKRFRVPSQRFARRQASHQVISEVPRFLLEATAFGGMLGILLFLMIRREGGLGATLPLIAMYAFAGYRLLPAMQQIYQNLSALKFSNTVLSRLHSELTQRNTVESGQVLSTHRSAALGLQSSLELIDVSFAYPGAQERALDGVHMSIPAKATVGIVGATGAGKTTVVDIILGLLDPDSGKLRVDGTPIVRENVRRWQYSVGYVPQHIFLIDDTVAANIAFGVEPERIDPEAVERAARIAELHDFVLKHLPQGYQTRVGERGVRLSGGQRQRIGIARALYHDPSVLVLDEATSALDNVTEKAVMDAVQNLGHKKTIIMIAHRLSTVRPCDRIFVLDQGHVVASGTYDELTKTSPQFRAMARVSG